MKKYSRAFLLATAFLLSASLAYGACPSSLADFCGAANKEVGGAYKVTLKKVELSKDGVHFIVVGESGGTQIDIGAGNAGANIASFASGAAIPAGVYKYIRVTVSRTFFIQGYGSNGGQYYYTSSATGTSPEGFPVAVPCATWPPGGGCPSYNEVPIKVPSDATSVGGSKIEIVNNGNDLRLTESFSPITVKEGENVSLSIKFHTQNALGFDCNGGVCAAFPLPPDIDIEAD